MPTISDNAGNSISFLSLRYQAAPPVETTETFERAGSDGFVARRTGVRAPVHTRIGIVDLVSDAQYRLFRDKAMGMVGRLVTVTEHDGDNTHDVLVVSVTPLQRQDVIKAVGGLSGTSAKIIASFRFELRATR